MATWIIDTVHSEIGFKVKHLVVSTASGKFTAFEGKLEGEKDDFTDGKISFSADIDSLHTGNEQRDGHLKSADFFDAANHPRLSFISTSVEKKDGSNYIIKGNLTLKSITKPVVLQAEYGGAHKNFQGNDITGWEITGKINRQDFGLTWSAVTEAGGIVVSDEVKLIANIEAIKQ
jgi:polyisoprenoid-binding protein YceI